MGNAIEKDLITIYIAKFLFGAQNSNEAFYKHAVIGRRL